MDKRYGRVQWGPQGERKATSFANRGMPLAWNRKAAKTGEPWRVFCGSLCDVFDDHPSIDEAWRSELWMLIETTPHLTWMLLTKRPENVVRLTPEWLTGGWPDNVWLGVSVENQEAADKRLPILAEIPAAVHFASCEPLIGPVDLGHWMILNDINWVIAGAESGAGARPMELDWARSLRDQCGKYDVPYFLKQFVENGRKIPEPELDGRRWVEFPGELKT